MSTVFMRVTNDKYELPVAVADTLSELAHMVGVDPSSVWHALHRGWKKSTYVAVEVDDYDNE